VTLPGKNELSTATEAHNGRGRSVDARPGGLCRLGSTELSEREIRVQANRVDPGAGAACARSVANWFQLTVAPGLQNLTALNATVAVEATVASVGWGRSMLQAAARSAAGQA